MERRKFIIGAGALATGSAAAVGTGAFTSAQAERDVEVAVADDSDSFLSIQVSDGPNGAYAEETDGTIELNFDDDATGTFMGEGVNEGSVYTFDDVFRIVNNQSANDPIGHEIDIQLEKDGLSGVDFYFRGDSDNSIVEPNWGGEINPSQQPEDNTVGVKIDEEDLDTEDVEGSVTIKVEESPSSFRD